MAESVVEKKSLLTIYENSFQCYLLLQIPHQTISLIPVCKNTSYNVRVGQEAQCMEVLFHPSYHYLRISNISL